MDYMNKAQFSTLCDFTMLCITVCFCCDMQDVEFVDLVQYFIACTAYLTACMIVLMWRIGNEWMKD